MNKELTLLFETLAKAKQGEGNALPPRTAKIMREGKPKMAKKLIEEAAEVALDCLSNKPEDVINESADLLYHLTLIWAEMNIKPETVFQEMERRRTLYGVAEKLQKPVKPQEADLFDV
jgi:phosphoribosyl-ATP pyrophosphohydrolase